MPLSLSHSLSSSSLNSGLKLIVNVAFAGLNVTDLSPNPRLCWSDPRRHRPPQAASHHRRPSLYSLCCDWFFFFFNVFSYEFGGYGGGVWFWVWWVFWVFVLFFFIGLAVLIFLGFCFVLLHWFWWAWWGCGCTVIFMGLMVVVMVCWWLNEILFYCSVYIILLC